MESVLNHLEVGVLLLNRQGRVEFANRFCVEKEITTRDFEGKRYYETIRSLDLISLLGDFLEGCREPGEVEHKGRRYRVTCAGEELLIVQMEDVTAVRDAERLQREFVASVSHELSTPLTAVRGLLETALLSEQPRRELLEKALRRIREFENLINSLRLLTLTEGKRSRPLREVEIEEVIMDVLEDLREKFEEKGITPKVSIEGRIRITCDREKVYILLRNVVDNAVRYNRERGRVSISVSEEEGNAIIAVKDTGRGISERDLEFVRITLPLQPSNL